ncbi:MAG: hypothetical protein DPW16_20525 [Chloroflexi bacterium]|nr:hypothetical protein [Chloroflexota bacterium]
MKNNLANKWRIAIIGIVFILGTSNQTFHLNQVYSQESSPYPMINESPSWSPDGTLIAYNSSRGSNSDIWIMNADGSNPRNLTNSPDNDYWPNWSPDGQYIAFYSEQGEKTNIWIMNADGSNPLNLTSTLVGNSEKIAWSPDGSQIAFASSNGARSNFLKDIFIATPDGLNLFNITQDEEFAYDDPTWSPDGRYILVSVFDRASINSDGIRIISVMDGSVLPLTANRMDLRASWSPNGNQIAIFSIDSDISYWVISPDGTNLTGLVSLPSGGGFEWSPDGKLLAITALTGELSVGDLTSFSLGTFFQKQDIWIVDAAGNQTNLTMGRANGFRFDWSPNGTKIAFTSADGENKRFDVWVMNADGSNPMNLTLNH